MAGENSAKLYGKHVMAIETSILDIIENGILIINRDFEIVFWNKWLANHTGISKEKAQGNTLEHLFPETSFAPLKRKIKIALKVKSSTFSNSSIDKFIIPIELKKITKSIFRHMRQDVTITPLSDTEVGVILYDASPLLEAKALINDQLLLVEKLAKIDYLTQCYNRKMFNALLAAEIKKSNRYSHIFSLIILDIDNFKSVNDTYGHLVGDEVLIQVAQLADSVLRKCDVFARWGGEEFCILLPETDLQGAAITADKVRHAIETHDFGKPGRQTCSLGVAEYSHGISEQSLVNKADDALYHAKKHGKNQVAVFAKEKISLFHPLNP